MGMIDTLYELGAQKVEPYDGTQNLEQSVDKQQDDNVSGFFRTPAEQMRGDLSELKRLQESGVELSPEQKQQFDDQILQTAQSVITEKNTIGKDPREVSNENMETLEQLSRAGFDKATESLSLLKEENSNEKFNTIESPAVFNEQKRENIAKDSNIKEEEQEKGSLLYQKEQKNNESILQESGKDVNGQTDLAQLLSKGDNVSFAQRQQMEEVVRRTVDSLLNNAQNDLTDMLNIGNAMGAVGAVANEMLPGRNGNGQKPTPNMKEDPNMEETQVKEGGKRSVAIKTLEKLSNLGFDYATKALEQIKEFVEQEKLKQEEQRRRMSGSRPQPQPGKPEINKDKEHNEVGAPAILKGRGAETGKEYNNVDKPAILTERDQPQTQRPENADADLTAALIAREKKSRS